jgi:hypothetical protein
MSDAIVTRPGLQAGEVEADHCAEGCARELRRRLHPAPQPRCDGRRPL